MREPLQSFEAMAQKEWREISDFGVKFLQKLFPDARPSLFRRATPMGGSLIKEDSPVLVIDLQLRDAIESIHERCS